MKKSSKNKHKKNRKKRSVQTQKTPQDKQVPKNSASDSASKTATTPKKQPKKPSKFQNVLINMSLIVGTILLFLMMFEGILQLNLISTPVYTSLADLEDDALTDARNNIFQVRHGQYLFNDRYRSVPKPAGIRKRIIVVGDSFLQGTSIPYDTVWSHKLEAKIAKKYPDVEVITIGRSGWPTITEFQAIQQLGMPYQPDLVIYGFVVNDLQLKWGASHPDAGEYPNSTAVTVRDMGGFIASGFSLLQPLFPEATVFFSAYASQFAKNISLSFIEDETYLWHKNGWGIYFSDSTYLKPFDKLLGQIKSTSKQDSIQNLFVLTPNNYHTYFEKNHNVVKSYLEKHELPYVDTYPTVNKELSHYTYHDLKANPTDAHPGNLMNEIFAQETYTYLEKTGFFE